MRCQPGTVHPMCCEQAVGGVHPVNSATLVVTFSGEHMMFDVKYVLLVLNIWARLVCLVVFV